MPVVPRLRDTLSILRLTDGDDVLFSIRDDGGELFRLTGDGWHLLTLLDGVSEEREVQAAYRNRIGRDMPLDELRKFCSALDEAGVLNTTDGSVRVLAYLKDHDVKYRTARPDRRKDMHPDEGDIDDPRVTERRDESERTAGFQAGIAHLNDGRSAQGLATFRALAQEHPGDVRVEEFIGHLEFLTAAEADPDLEVDRRDPTWDAFDRALTALLRAGRCPSCSEPIEVHLYGLNRCGGCGASFTATALRRADEERRVDDR
jgi:hypothetical protein